MRYKTGDLTEATEKYIAHGCNSHGVMGSGVALAIKNKFPEAFKSYKKFIKECDRLGKTPLGLCQAALIDDGKSWEDSKVILNLITQYGYGNDGFRYAMYDAIDDALRDTGLKNEEIAISLIGCGLGGARWSVVEMIIKEYEQDSGNRFTVYQQ